MPVEDIETVNHHCGDLLECGGERAAKNEARNSIQRFDVKSTAEKLNFLALPSYSRRATLFAHLTLRPASRPSHQQPQIISCLDCQLFALRFYDRAENAGNGRMDSNLNSLAGGCEMPGHPGDITEREAEVGILPSHGIAIHALPFADRINNLM